ncbi:MAG: hypothetical protein K2X93_00445 [Candidatus Obscuribacterales bacterium]|nr:hypothetical protein [Candidatus Obscuribacterales bacterium]
MTELSAREKAHALMKELAKEERFKILVVFRVITVVPKLIIYRISSGA